MSRTVAARLIDDLAAETLPVADVPWLDARRADALAIFRRMGVPHRRIENWKYTDLKTALEAANDFYGSAIEWRIASVPAGVELYDLSDLANAPDWVKAHLGKAAGADAMPAASLVLARCGFALRVPKGQVVAERLQVEF